MANKTLFSKKVSRKKGFARPAVEVADTVNNAGGKAFSYTAKHALAQIACTNTFNGTYYASAEANLELAKQAVAQLHGDPEFIAKVAVYSRSKGYLKDMPAYLVAQLKQLDNKLFRKVFRQVIDNGKMLRNFIQIARSGQAGKVYNMSAGSIRHAINEWFATRSSNSLFRASIGNDPSMRDILRMARPKPENAEKAALYAYLKDAEIDEKTGDFITRNQDGSVKYRNSYANLPDIVKNYERFKKTHEGEIPKVDFRMLDSVLTKEEAKKLWASQALNGGWQMTRMNLNNFLKYGVFDDKAMIKVVADRLSNRELIKEARCYPYQLMMAYNAVDVSMPLAVRNALQDAMEAAIDNVPTMDGQVYVCVDTSGSMGSAVTGNRGTATTKVRCVDVAGLFAASVLRKNPETQVLPFDTSVHLVKINPRDSVMTNAKAFARNGGGTDCSCALRHLNQKDAKGDAVIFVSDNESWVDSAYGYGYGRSTGLLSEWQAFKRRNPNARLVCIDLQTSASSQVKEHQDILQVGGWSDTVFDVVASFIEHGHSTDHWVEMIESISLDSEQASETESVTGVGE